MNVDAEPMTFDEVRKLAKQLEIPDFDVMELDKYKSLAKKYKEPANCIIWIPFEDGGKLGHFVSCFRDDDGTLNYQDSFGEMNDFPLTGTNRVFRVNKVKYQSTLLTRLSRGCEGITIVLKRVQYINTNINEIRRD